MKNLAILLISILFINPVKAQRGSSSFVGKPESRALYASNIAKAIQIAWENEISLKEKKEMLLDEIIFGQDNESKDTKSVENAKFSTTNIDEIEEVLGIKEEIVQDPIKKKTQIPPTSLLKTIPISETTTPMKNVEEIKEERNSYQSSTTYTEKYTTPKSSITINNDDAEVDSVYSIPEISPMFPGGVNAMKRFFAKNIITPESTGQIVKGKVFLRFMVNKNGELSKIYLVKGLTDNCNKEALRVMKKMPSWIPAMQDGKTINSWHTLPIYFEIE